MEITDEKQMKAWVFMTVYKHKTELTIIESNLEGLVNMAPCKASRMLCYPYDNQVADVMNT